MVLTKVNKNFSFYRCQLKRGNVWTSNFKIYVCVYMCGVWIYIAVYIYIKGNICIPSHLLVTVLFCFSFSTALFFVFCFCFVFLLISIQILHISSRSSSLTSFSSNLRNFFGSFTFMSFLFMCGIIITMPSL